MLTLVFSCIIWLGAFALLFKRPVLGPIFSYLSLLLLSTARTHGALGGSYPLLPLNSTILVVWACMTLVVVIATTMQPVSLRSQTTGTAYMLGGAVAGLAVGLLGFTFSASISLLYACMVIGVAAGVFFGYLLFANTPAGAPFGLRSGRFFSTLLAKGFPVAITVMMAGIPCVLALALANNL